MRVLVTGGDGFIGKHLVKRLCDKGHYVTVVGRSTEFPVDVLDIEAIENCFLRTRPDVVVHLAALKRGDKDELYKINVAGTMNVMQMCSRFDVKKLVFTSTAAVYGHSNQEESAVCAPTSVYGKSKLVGEGSVLGLGKRSLVLRLFNVYGEGGDSVVNVIDNCLKTGKEFRAFNKGVRFRDYVSVEAVVEAICIGIREEGLFGIVNVGTGQGMSVNQLVDLAKQCGKLEYFVEDVSERFDSHDSIADTVFCEKLFGLKYTRQCVEDSLFKFWRR